ncbi:AbgT family transporter [Phenylobacterium sp.]|uniref:AbgT family transporter n=1 Tax=Phenylobacterium sp. TaxID=1871053 RepID=UPI0027321FA6|nr:AbgT family transporter [Phenylobacterium sp.]MDP2214948.1 AbgT family transporter [Phenylobacterium sp.]
MAMKSGFLGMIEKVGNRLPDPVVIFVWMIAALFVGSMIAAGLGASAVNPATGETLTAVSLATSENLRRLFVDMPRTLTSFAPLGFVLTVMLGAGVAERTGLFSAAMRASVSKAPKALLTPIIIFTAIISNHAADAAYVVLVPLAGVVFAAAGRHPVAGIAAAFAGVSGGFSANVFPGHLDALLLGITEPAARLLDPTWTANIAGNWWFILAMTMVFTPLGWWVTDKVVEPRLGPWVPVSPPPPEAAETEEEMQATSARERKGLIWAGIGAVVVIGLWTAMSIGPAAPFINAEGGPGERMTPFYSSLVAGFFLLFLVCGVAYGAAAGTVKNQGDVVRLTGQSMAEMGPYIVLAFVAAHFVAMFNWSNLGAIIAIHGAEGLRASGMPTPLLLTAMVLLAASINLFIGSASAKWAALAPILVPMLMLLGVSPEMSTAAYRMGDSTTNIVTPLMVYFPLILGFAQRYQKDFGVGSLMAVMVPYSLFFMAAGLIMVLGWTSLDLPLGPGATVGYVLPTLAQPLP